MKNKILWCLMWLYFLSFNTVAQSPYSFNSKKETILIGTSALALGTGLVINFRMNPLTVKEIANLDRADINSFDVEATYNYSSGARIGSDIGIYTSHVLPFLFLTQEKARKDFKTIAILYGETFLAVEGITNLTKRATKRSRPFVYNENVSLSKKTKLEARFSFFSGHTSISAANGFFFAKVFSDYFPESGLKPVVWVVGASIPAVTGYLRVKAGKHYPTDVITGYLVGAAIGYLIPQMHRKKRHTKSGGLSFDPYRNGMRLVYTF